jgi:hypothetical protein
MSVSFDLDVGPADSPLAKALFGTALCQDQSAFDIPVTLYEVGERGEVLSMISMFESGGRKLYMRTEVLGGQQFTLEDGCFTLGYDSEQFEFDRTFSVPGPCGLGLPAITRQGQVFADPIGDYICLSGAVSHCHDCWGGDGVWHSDTVIDGTYTALGSLDAVLLAGWAAACNQPTQYVDIAAGDSIDFSYALRITYRASPSPEEIGYELFEFPTFP